MTTTAAIACPTCHLRFPNRAELVAHVDEEHATPIGSAPPPRGLVTVPVDPDEPPPLALSLATTLARQADLALDVVAVPHIGGPLSTAAYLRTNVSRVHGLPPARRRWHVLDGAPGPALLAHVRTSGTDLVCMGTRGHRGVGELLFGSVAHQIVARATVPVLLTGPRVTAVPDSIRTVVACVDGSEPAAAALGVADRLRRALGAELFLVEVVRPNAAVPADLLESAEVARNARTVAEPWPGYDILHGADAAEAIVGYTHGMDAALLVTGTHGRSGLWSALLGSVAGKVVATSPLPTVVVPPGTTPAAFLA